MDITKNIYSIFNIKNAEFFNINIAEDTAKFIQPYTVENTNSEIARKCNATAVDFFNTVHDYLLKKDYNTANTIFSSHLKEPKENCLGYSGNNTSGKGLRDIAHYAMQQILDQPHLINEIKQIADLQLYVKNIMHDRISDLYTNVVRNELNNYTLEQCRKYNMMHLVKEVNFGSYWDAVQHTWTENAIKQMLVINEKPILLVPKNFLVGSYGPNTMYRNVFLVKLINEDLLKNESSLIKRRKNGETYISKKDKHKQLKMSNFKVSKEIMIQFAKENPNCTQKLRQVLEETRQKRLQNKINRR